jgi:hypothetical protein
MTFSSQQQPVSMYPVPLQISIILWLGLGRWDNFSFAQGSFGNFFLKETSKR